MLGFGLSTSAPLDWQKSAGWIAAGAALQLDFAQQRYSKYGALASLSELVVCASASQRWGTDSAGNLTAFSANTARINDKGLLVERAAEGLVDDPGDVHLWADDTATSTRTGEQVGPFAMARVACAGGASWHRKRSTDINATTGDKYAISVYFRFGSSGKMIVMARVPDGAGGYGYPSIQIAADETITINAPSGWSPFSNAALSQVGTLYCLTAVLEILHDGAVIMGPGPYSEVAGEYVDIAGFQVEAGEFPTSFIPGGGIRESELVTLTDPASLSGDGTWFMQFQTGQDWNKEQHIVLGRDVLKSPAASNALQSDDGPNSTSHGNVNDNAIAQIAIACRANGVTSSLDGQPVITGLTDLTGVGAQGIFSIGSSHLNAGHLNGFIRSLTYWPHAKSDADLVALTSH